MNIRKHPLAIATITAALSVSAWAGEDTMSHSAMKTKADDAPSFSRLDTNQDGMISKKEAQAGEEMNEKLTENWSELDTNKDDQLDRSEFAKFEPVKTRETDDYDTEVEPLENDASRADPLEGRDADAGKDRAY